jgi:prolyl oligopeptidase
MLPGVFRFFPPLRRVFLRYTSTATLATMSPTPWTLNSYPLARRSDHVEVYKSASAGEVRVPDPYQWLEEYTDETDKWTSAQEAFTRNYLDKNSDLPRLEAAFRRSNDYAKFYAPSLRDDNRWYWFYNSGLEGQTPLYRSKDSTLPDISKGEKGGGDIFFDPNALSEDGTASLATYAFSKCGKYFAYGISLSGSDFVTVYVRHLDSPLIKGVDLKNDHGRLPEEIKFVKFSSITWTPDSKGFFYQRYPDTSDTVKVNGTIATDGDLDAMIYYHRIGSSQSEDVLIYQDKVNRDWMFSVEITEDGKYLCFYVMKDSSRQNLLWIADLEPEKIGLEIHWKKVFNDWGAEFDVITNEGSLFYIRTNKSAPQYKVITVNIANDHQIKEFIPENEATLTSVSCLNKDYFGVVYKRNVKDEIYIYSKEGKEVERLAKDFVGYAYLTGREKRSTFFVTMIGFTSPGTVGRYDFTAPEGQRWSIYQTTKVNGLNPEDFEAQQVWYKSKDGTRVPMFIVRHKSTKFDGTAPAVQYGYGGFSISMDPFFSSTILTFLQKYGAIFALPNIRGGGEFGEAWHKAGANENKKNCFDDFIAATDYLVKNKYADPKKVTINGGSNGGLLVSACINRAAEGTFACALAEVGVHDLLKVGVQFLP